MFRTISVLGLTLAAIGLSVSVASAGILINVTKISGRGAGDFGTPDQDLNGKGWSSYQINVSTDDGDLITAVDVSFDGALHQRWADINFDGDSDPTSVGPAGNDRGDSHLTLVQGALVGSAPTEDNNTHPDFDSPLPDGQFDYGVGTYLRGAWGIPGASQTTTTTIAMIVIPNDFPCPPVTLTYDISTSNGRFSGTEDFCIPEPAAALLAVIGMIPCSIPRRRRGELTKTPTLDKPDIGRAIQRSE